MNARTCLAAAVLALLGACASVPPGPPAEVVRLQNDLGRLHADRRIAPNAANELQEADAAVGVLAVDARHMDAAVYEHRVYIADRMIQTAEAAGLARYAEVRADELGAERDRLLVDTRTHQLRDAQLAVDDARAQAAQEREDAAMARADAASTRSEMDALRADLVTLQAQQTQRGMVITLGDVLFEVDRAELKPGAARTLDELVRALSDDRSATVSIEGHTDATGGAQYNAELSLRRADSVKAYLAMHGVDPARITTRGLGQDYPVASNATESGRLQNRRVEVIVQTNVARR